MTPFFSIISKSQLKLDKQAPISSLLILISKRMCEARPCKCRKMLKKQKMRKNLIFSCEDFWGNEKSIKFSLQTHYVIKLGAQVVSFYFLILLHSYSEQKLKYKYIEDININIKQPENLLSQCLYCTVSTNSIE